MHDRGYMTDYNYIGNIAWPVMASLGIGTYQWATLSCLRVSNGTQGSIAPTGESLQHGTGDATFSGQGGLENYGRHIWLNGLWVMCSTVFVSCAFIF